MVDELQTEFLGAMERAVTRRRLVVLKGGGVAMAHVCGRHGDAVIVGEGWRMPILLRPEEGGEKWRIVGEVFVFGYMNGEALGGNDTEDGVREFVIS